MNAHPYYQDPRRLNCMWCARARAQRCHQPLIWRILHPLATWR
jgi:hypothetical protein